MKIVQKLLLLTIGVLCGVAGARYFTIRPVHAQEIFGLNPKIGCIAEVPKSWGDFKGASSYGLAFEDQDGTIRILLNPPCSNGISSSTISSPNIDLQVKRK